MPYEFYKVFHFLGIFLTLSGLIGLATSALTQPAGAVQPVRRYSMISHGVGLTLILVSGFGLAARLGYMSGLPTWIYYKLAIWLVAGAALSLVKRAPQKARVWLVCIIGLFTLAAYIATNKPGM